MNLEFYQVILLLGQNIHVFNSEFFFNSLNKIQSTIIHRLTIRFGFRSCWCFLDFQTKKGSQIDEIGLGRVSHQTEVAKPEVWWKSLYRHLSTRIGLEMFSRSLTESYLKGYTSLYSDFLLKVLIEI